MRGLSGNSRSTPIVLITNPEAVIYPDSPISEYNPRKEFFQVHEFKSNDRLTCPDCGTFVRTNPQPQNTLSNVIASVRAAFFELNRLEFDTASTEEEEELEMLQMAESRDRLCRIFWQDWDTDDDGRKELSKDDGPDRLSKRFSLLSRMSWSTASRRLSITAAEETIPEVQEPRNPEMEVEEPSKPETIEEEEAQDGHSIAAPEETVLERLRKTGRRRKGTLDDTAVVRRRSSFSW